MSVSDEILPEEWKAWELLRARKLASGEWEEIKHTGSSNPGPTQPAVPVQIELCCPISQYKRSFRRKLRGDAQATDAISLIIRTSPTATDQQQVVGGSTVSEIFFLDDVHRELKQNDENVAECLEYAIRVLDAHQRKVSTLQKRKRFCEEEEEQIREFLATKMQQATDLKIALEAGHKWFYHKPDEERVVSLSYLDALAGKDVPEADLVPHEPSTTTKEIINQVHALILQFETEETFEVAIADVLAVGLKEGLDEETTKEAIDWLKRKGEFYSSRQGFLRRL